MDTFSGQCSGNTPVFSSIEDAVEDIRNGRMIIVVDDDCRENEGDLVMAGSKVNTDAINFMVRFARACASLSGTISSPGFSLTPW